MFNRLSGFALSASVLVLSACAEPVSEDASVAEAAPAQIQSANAPRTVVEALAPYYAQLDYTRPVARPGPALPAVDQALTSIAFGSCNTGHREIPILNTIADQEHDLFMYVGDNVYGDARALNGFLTPWLGSDPGLIVDEDQLPALSEDRHARWQRISEADFLTDAEKRALLGFEAVGGSHD